MSLPGQFFRAISALSFLALLVLSYVDIIYLPQKKTLDEQHAALMALERALRQDHMGQEVLKKRVRALEAALVKFNSSAAAALGVDQAAFEVAQEVVAGEAPAAAGPLGAKGAADNGTTRNAAEKLWRKDDKCGKGAPLPNGKPAQCNPESNFPCCAASGWCGGTPEHCECPSCMDYRGKQVPPELAPYNKEQNKTIAMVIPFRDRGVHLERFRERLQSHVDSWNARGVSHTWVAFVVEQFDTALFNRGWLFNVGFHHASDYAKKTGKPFDCIVMQDIDILPTPVVDYGWCIWPIQLSGEIECWSWSVPYPDNVGGVTSMSPDHWKMINGFSSEYEGWGGEDDDLYLRLKQSSLLRGNCHTWCKEAKKPTVPMVYRPPLGQGRFTCLHDGDHTPRQRAPNDAPMWSRLNAMKANSKRWRLDGISNLAFHSAGPSLWSKACDGCVAPEDPVSKRRPFSEMWVRVSGKPIPPVSRIDVKLLGSFGCNRTSLPLRAIPAGLEGLQREVVELFGSECGLDLQWANGTNFVLVDLMLGQAAVVGFGTKPVIPDSSLPPLPGPGEQPQSLPAAGGEHLMQGQRLSRWIRKLPPAHRGWILADHVPAAARQQHFIDQGRHVPQTAPVCMSSTSFGGSRKFRMTPGTQWCGDGGWTNLDHFLALRSKTSVPKDSLVPICISFNPKVYTYRFEQSEADCAGVHSASGTTWKHAGTIHVSKDATGEKMCVGMLLAGEKTRWKIQKGARCNQDGFQHSFSFSAMAAGAFRTPLAHGCLLVAEPLQPGVQALQRLATTEQCHVSSSAEPGFGPWKPLREVLLLSRRHSSSDVRICPAKGAAELPKEKEAGQESAKSKAHLWRVFKGDFCSKSKHSTRESDNRRIRWAIQQDPPLFVPANASGSHLRLCRIDQSEKKGLGFFFTLSERACQGKGAKKELSFHDFGAADALRYVHLIDEVT